MNRGIFDDDDDFSVREIEVYGDSDSSVDVKIDQEWMSEPDRVDCVYMGYQCIISRDNITGSLCGYVGIVEGHPYFGVDYDDLHIDVHGGLTFSEFGGSIFENNDQWMKLYYKDEFNADGKKLWWVGFDCCHYNDVLPMINCNALGNTDLGIFGDSASYKNMHYVTDQVFKIVRQCISADY